ncbi:MAG: hypothetical protein ACM3VS_00335 [Candidatus Dadabacteria bacterium]
MKPILLAICFAFLFGCGTERVVQATLMDATIVKVETITRYPNANEKMLTWETPNHVTYITFEPINSSLSLGDSRKVLVQR